MSFEPSNLLRRRVQILGPPIGQLLETELVFDGNDVL
jgi:hypothetical protein